MSATTDTTPKVPAATLLDLPPELLVNILSFSSIKEIQRSRFVCHYTQDIVDEESNHVTLSTPRMSTDLHGTIASVINYDPNIGFFAALKAFFEHRGVQANEYARFQDLFAFAGHWYTRGEGGPAVPRKPCIRILTIVAFARSIVNLHVQLHLPDLPFPYDAARVPTDADAFVRAVRVDARAVLQFDHSQVMSLHQTIQEKRTDEGGIMGNATIRHQTLGKGDTLPDWPLTYLDHLSRATAKDMDAEKKRRLRGGWSIKELREVLGVELPEIPDYGFAYYVKTAWAYERVRQAAEGGRLRRKDRAMVVEQIYLF